MESEYGNSLEADIQGDTSGAFQRLLVMAVNCKCIIFVRVKVKFEWNLNFWIVKRPSHFNLLNYSKCKGVKDENFYDPVKAREQAEQLYAAGEGKIGTDEDTFVEVLAHAGQRQAYQIFEEYKKISGITVEQVTTVLHTKWFKVSPGLPSCTIKKLVKI